MIIYSNTQTSQATVLKALRMMQAHTSMKYSAIEIGRYAGVSTAAAAVTLQRLESKGLARRTRGEPTMWHLTSDGLSVEVR